MRTSSRRCPRLLAASLILTAGCTSGEQASTTAETVTALHAVPASLEALAGEQFLDHPWPSDLRLEGGAPRFAGFHNPRGRQLIAEYVAAVPALVDGFSPVAAGYLRFDGPLEVASLPDGPLATTADDASVQLVDVDPASPEHGRRTPIMLSFREAAGQYVLPNTLRFMPALGYPLRPATRYAVVVTRDVRGAGGEPVVPSAELEQVLGLEPAQGPAAALAEAWGPSLDALEGLGLARADIAHLSVFTTADPTREVMAVRDHLRANVEPPGFITPEGGWVVSVQSGGLVEYQARFGPLPRYQKGTVPFTLYGDGGELNFVSGEPEVVDTFDLRFSLSVPNGGDCPMPEAGYPIVLFAHGTGGSWRSYLNNGVARDLAARCLASMGVDQIFHGDYPGSPAAATSVQLVFFNFQNAAAAHANIAQSAIDEVQRARLFTEGAATIGASVSHTEQEIRFDPSKVLYFGHSQGGLNGPLYFAIDDSTRGGVLSGSGAVIALTLLEKTQPAPAIPTLVKTLLLGLSTEEAEEFDIFHPASALAQAVVDAVDPINFARHTVLEPRDGFAPKSVYMTVGVGPDGVGDTYTPPRGTEAQGIAMGLPLMLPGQRTIAELAYGGPEPVAVPAEGLAGNLAAGKASGVLAQWAPAGNDGHFVVFDIPAARTQAADFLAELAADPAGRVPAP